MLVAFYFLKLCPGLFSKAVRVELVDRIFTQNFFSKLLKRIDHLTFEKVQDSCRSKRFMMCDFSLISLMI